MYYLNSTLTSYTVLVYILLHLLLYLQRLALFLIKIIFKFWALLLLLNLTHISHLVVYLFIVITLLLLLLFLFYLHFKIALTLSILVDINITLNALKIALLLMRLIKVYVGVLIEVNRRLFIIIICLMNLLLSIRDLFIVIIRSKIKARSIEILASLILKILIVITWLVIWRYCLRLTTLLAV